MPVVIFHGDNNLVIANKIDEMRKSYPVDSIERVSLKNESFEQLLIKLNTASFFSDQRLFIVDDCDEKKVDLSRINVDSHTTLVLIFTKELTGSSAVLKLAEEKHYRIFALSQPQDKRIFTFLDLIAEKNNKAFSMVDELVDDFGGVYILTMLVFLLRRLVLPIGKVPSFVEGKLKKQKGNFSAKNLTDLYKQTLQADYRFKTGKGDERTELLLLLQNFLKK